MAIMQEDLPLHNACKSNDIETIRYLLSQNLNIFETNYEGQTPLHIAAMVGNIEIIKLLVSAGALVNAKDNFKSTPLHQAVCCNQIGAVKLLILENRKSINLKQHLGNTPLHIAAMNGYNELVKLLISCQADIDPENLSGDTPLGLAALAGNEDTSKMLIDHGSDPNYVCADNGIGPLYIAIDTVETAVVKVLLESGADPNQKYRFGNTPLHLAAKNGSEDILNLLIAAGADVNAKNDEKKTPLNLAMENYHKKVCTLLLDAGATMENISLYQKVKNYLSKKFLRNGIGEYKIIKLGRGALKYAILLMLLFNFIISSYLIIGYVLPPSGNASIGNEPNQRTLCAVNNAAKAGLKSSNEFYLQSGSMVPDLMHKVCERKVQRLQQKIGEIHEENKVLIKNQKDEKIFNLVSYIVITSIVGVFSLAIGKIVKSANLF